MSYFSTTIDLDRERSLHAVTAGEGQDIVLIHGAFTTHQDWVSGPFETLTELGRVIAIDRPGHGFSRRPRFAGAPREQAVHIYHGLQALNVVRPIIIAHSFGARTAVAYAEQFPEEVEHLILVAPLAFAEPRPFEHIVFAPRAIPFFGPIWATMMASTLDEPMLETLHRIMFWPDEPDERWKRNYPWDLVLDPDATVANGEDFASAHPLAIAGNVDYCNVQTPIQVIAGSQDLIIGHWHQGQALANSLPNAHLTLLDGVGHMLHHSRPDAIFSAAWRVLEERGESAPS